MAADAVAGENESAQFGILGPLEVSRAGSAVPLGGPQQRAVLALLLLEANRVVSMDRLAEDVWGGNPPEGWVTTLRTYVFHLRRALEPGRSRGAAGDVLVTRGRGYLLHVTRDHLDAALFQDLFTAGRAALDAGRFAEAAQTLRQALDLWRSGLLADLADYAFTRPEAARLEELRLTAVETRIDADLALGRHDALTAELEQLAAAHPLRERLHGQLILALYRCAGRLTRWPPTGGSATCSPMSSASIPGSRCGASINLSSPRTRRWSGPMGATPNPKAASPALAPRLPPRRQNHRVPRARRERGGSGSLVRIARNGWWRWPGRWSWWSRCWWP